MTLSVTLLDSFAKVKLHFYTMDGDDEVEVGQEITPKVETAPRVTGDLLRQMRRAGLPKPASVTWSEWCGPKRLNHKHSRIAMLAANGLNQVRISEETGISAAWISIILNTQRIKAEIERYQKEMYGINPQDLFKRLANKSVVLAEEIIDDPQERRALKYAVAKDFMDRFHGKARETLEVKNNTLRDLFDAMDKMGVLRAPVETPVDKLPSTINITPVETKETPVEESPKVKRDEYSDLDAWISLNIPKSGGSL